MTITPVLVPKWGMAMDEGTLTNWLVEEGVAVASGQDIADVETTKIANVVEAPDAGLLYQAVQEGSIVPVGGLLAVIASSDESRDAISAFIEANRSEGKTAANDTPVDPTRTIDVNGLTLRYLEKGGDSGTPIVLVHGFGADLNTWMFNQDKLAGHNRAIALDLPGHGGSTKTVGDGSIAGFARILIGFLDALGLNEVHMVGHSLGAAICLDVSLTHPDRVQSLVLLAPAGLGADISAEFLHGFVQETRSRKLEAVLRLLVANPDMVTRDMVEDVLRQKRVDGVQEGLSQIIEANFKSGQQSTRFDDRLGELSTRPAIVVGEQDRIITPAHFQFLADNITLTTLSDTGHLVHMESAEKVNAIILEVVSSV